MALVDVLQRRMLALIMRAYANLTAAQLASYLGMPEAQALAGGWTRPSILDRRINSGVEAVVWDGV